MKNVMQEEYNVGNTVENQIKRSNKKEDNNMFRRKDKSDRATIEQCLDPKTLMKLEKLINKGDLEYYQGCISTGKEANVYYGKGFGGKHLAIKVYKTSILVFKDRERYINGEFRFRHGYCKSNPRKMVSIWAEKEVRNLKRIQLSGIKTPTPYLLKSNLIIMDLIGIEENAAPRLRDAEIEDYEPIYISVIFIMKTMFKSCKLVHSDLSEYNLLYHNGEIYVIDVAQAVEDDHPNALAFLKRDCININNYFHKCGVDILTDKQLFDLVSTLTKKEILVEDITEMLQKARELNKLKVDEDDKYFDLQNTAFEMFEFPRTLDSVDEGKIRDNSDIKNALTKICGIVNVESKNDEDNLFEDNDDIEEEEESDDDEVEFDAEGKVIEKTANENEEVKKKSKYDPFEGMSKSERQAKVKEENRLKRQNKKFTKYEKQKKIEKTSGKKK